MCPSWQYARQTTAIYAANPTLPANSPPSFVPFGPIRHRNRQQILVRPALLLRSGSLGQVYFLLAISPGPRSRPRQHGQRGSSGPTKYVANYSKNRRFYVHFGLGLHLESLLWLWLCCLFRFALQTSWLIYG